MNTDLCVSAAEACALVLSDYQYQCIERRLTRTCSADRVGQQWYGVTVTVTIVGPATLLFVLFLTSSTTPS